MDIVRLWLHEASRVYGDKLIEVKDMETFEKLKYSMAKVGFEVWLLKQSTMCIALPHIKIKVRVDDKFSVKGS
jgi:hypothetical protein